MRKKIDNILVCPQCKAQLKFKNNSFVCPKKHRYLIKDGIYIFDEGVDDFYEGKFTTQYDSTKSNNLVTRFLYNVWFTFSLGGRHFRSFSKFDKKFTHKGLVLDFGCGGGNKNYLSKGKVIGVDISIASLQKAKKIYSKVVISKGFNLPFADNSFDYIFSSQVFGHIPHKEKDPIIKELHRIAKSDAIIYATIECDSKDNPIINFMKKYPSLYKKYWLDMYGHYGLELPSEVVSRFKKNNFDVIKAEHGLRLFWEAGGYYEVLSPKYSQKNPFLKIFCQITKPFAKNIYLRLLWDLVGGIMSKLLEWPLPLNMSTGVIITARAKKETR